MAKDLICAEFQAIVDEYLIRHRSILDVMSKLQEASSRTNRALVKSVTGCGCVQINAAKQELPEDISLQELKEYMATHLQGQPCDACKEIIEAELGSMLFYIAAMCNLLDLDLYDIIIKEYKKLSMLGVYNLS